MTDRAMSCCGGHVGEHVDGCSILARWGAPNLFWAKAAIIPGGCWNWIGWVGANGRGAHRGAHAYRAAWEFTNGPIPSGLDIDHLCLNPRCVNPDHLEPVTRAENARRQRLAGSGMGAINASKTHCEKGHPFDEENTLDGSKWKGSPLRRCRTCHREIIKRLRNRAVERPVLRGCTCGSPLGCVEHGPTPRERSVQCRVCRKQTWNVIARCDKHLAHPDLHARAVDLKIITPDEAVV